MINRAAIAAARRQLATQPDFLRTTPLMRVSGRSLGVDCGEVWLKLEHLQVAGSFKARGMLYRLLANPVPESWACAARCLCLKSRPKPNAPACGPWAPRWW